MKYKRVLRVVIIILSIILVYMLYRSEYNIKPEINDIERSIGEYLNENVTVVDFIEVDNRLAVYFTLGSNENIGFTTLYKGINLRYQIRNAGYGYRNRVIKGSRFETKHGNYLAVKGTNYDEKIAKIRIETTLGEIFSADVENKAEIFLIFKTISTSFIEEYQLYDKDGNDISEYMQTYITTNRSGGHGKGKAELFLLNVYCFGIMLIGYVISRVFKER